MQSPCPSNVQAKTEAAAVCMEHEATGQAGSANLINEKHLPQTNLLLTRYSAELRIPQTSDSWITGD